MNPNKNKARRYKGKVLTHDGLIVMKVKDGQNQQFAGVTTALYTKPSMKTPAHRGVQPQTTTTPLMTVDKD